MFRIFIEGLKTRLQRDLPGEDAQFSMAPLSRERISQLPKTTYAPRKSAILILLFPMDKSLCTVLIQRPVYDGVHSGQVAFPGGKYEDSDGELKQTALREAFEEVGILPDQVEILGNLTDVYITPSNFLVSPFVGYMNTPPEFIINSYEVERIITPAVQDLSKEENKGIKSIPHSNGYKIKTPYYEIEGLTIWGATAMIISELNAVLAEITS